MTALAAALAIVVGATLGMLGAGGSILTVPIFLYVLGLPVKPAIAMSLPVVGVGAFAGFLLHRRRGGVNARLALTFGLIAAAAAFATARIARHVPDRLQLVMFGAVTIGAAWFMWRSAGRGQAVESARGEAATRALASARAVTLLSAQALGIGALTALIGVGGGFLIVPALVLVTGLPMLEAIGTSLLVIAMNTTSASLGYVGTVAIDWRIAGAFTAFMLVGLVIGTRLASRIPAGALRKIFAAVVLVVGIVVLAQGVH